MRLRIFFLLLIISNITLAQTNKPDEGDIGIRYGVAFNGSFAQSIALSGILKNGLEFGTGIKVVYANDVSENINTYTSVNGSTVTVTNQVFTNSYRYISISFLPYVFYHFPIKGNLDVYAGVNTVAGSGPRYLYYNNTYNITATNPVQVSETYKYPPGYQLGGGITLGCQYFFYKRLALGVEASLGVGYTAQKGLLTISDVASTGASSSTTENVNTHSLTVQSASSAGVYLTFYFERKRNKELNAYKLKTE